MNCGWKGKTLKRNSVGSTWIPGRCFMIKDALKLFITDQILDEIVLQTNNYAKRHCYQENKMRLSTNTYHTDSVPWKPLKRIELEAFIGLLIQAGVRHTNHGSKNELSKINSNVPIYHATISLRRFKNLLRLFRFDDREHPNKSDRLLPIRLLLHRFPQQLLDTSHRRKI